MTCPSTFGRCLIRVRGVEGKAGTLKRESVLDKPKLIQAIVDIEWDMFQRVKSAVPTPCQLRPEVFRRIRESVYETWSDEALRSCQIDFEKAKRDGRNLLTEKYAHMDHLIARADEDPLIDQIVNIETRWQEEIRRNYPTLYNRVCRSTNPSDDGRNFSIYLRSELQTYSRRTIELYHQTVIKALARNENLAFQSLETLVKKGGYRDACHAEVYLSRDER